MPMVSRRKIVVDACEVFLSIDAEQRNSELMKTLMGFFALELFSG
jgi:hypothetical protein